VRRELFGCCCYCYCCREQQGSWFGVVGLSAHPPYIHSCQPPAPGRRPPSLIDAGTGFIPPTGTNGVYLKAVSDARSPSWVPGGTWKPRHLEQSSFQKPWTLLATRRLHSRQLILLLALHQPTQSSRGRAWGQLAAQTSLQPSGCRGLRSRRRRPATETRQTPLRRCFWQPRRATWRGCRACWRLGPTRILGMQRGPPPCTMPPPTAARPAWKRWLALALTWRPWMAGRAAPRCITPPGAATGMPSPRCWRQGPALRRSRRKGPPRCTTPPRTATPAAWSCCWTGGQRWMQGTPTPARRCTWQPGQATPRAPRRCCCGVQRPRRGTPAGARRCTTRRRSATAAACRR
jgi:hypothetical protein